MAAPSAAPMRSSNASTSIAVESACRRPSRAKTSVKRDRAAVGAGGDDMRDLAGQAGVSAAHLAVG